MAYYIDLRPESFVTYNVDGHTWQQVRFVHLLCVKSLPTKVLGSEGRLQKSDNNLGSFGVYGLMDDAFSVLKKHLRCYISSTVLTTAEVRIYLRDVYTQKIY